MKLKLLVISLILLINVGFAFTLLLSTFYQSEDESTSKFSTIINLLSSDKLKRSDTDFIKIVQYRFSKIVIRINKWQVNSNYIHKYIVIREM